MNKVTFSFRKTVVVGAGYIAVEMAGILHSLGSDVTQVIRFDKVLRNFDETISQALTEEIEHSGINLLKNSNISEVRKTSSGTLEIKTKQGSVVKDVECLLWAIGRNPATDTLGLDKVGQLRRLTF